ncbi:MAG: GntR family transcriptional regulator [Alphaproteobacteria bacterium]|nr:GntR family transcriptional regulator [Alphaproteobacteria bacterium]
MTDPVVALSAFSTIPDGGLDDSEPMNGRVYATLRAQLMSGAFEPGEVVSIRSLAEKLGTSTMPVREALHRLIGDRALETRANRTIAVPLISRAGFRAIAEVRVALEGLAAERAAKHLSEAEIDRLDALTQGMAEAARLNEPQRYLALNTDFHHSIYRAAQNPVLLDLIEKLWVQAGPQFNFLFHTVGVPMRTIAPHEAIIAALRAGDGAGARQSVQRDISESIPDIVETLPV